MDEAKGTVDHLPRDEQAVSVRAQGTLFWQLLYLESLRRYIQLYTHHVTERRENAQWDHEKAMTRLALCVAIAALGAIYGIAELWFPAADSLKITVGAMMFLFGVIVLALLAFEAVVTSSEFERRRQDELEPKQ